MNEYYYFKWFIIKFLIDSILIGFFINKLLVVFGIISFGDSMDLNINGVWIDNKYRMFFYLV